MNEHIVLLPFEETPISEIRPDGSEIPGEERTELDQFFEDWVKAGYDSDKFGHPIEAPEITMRYWSAKEHLRMASNGVQFLQRTISALDSFYSKDDSYLSSSYSTQAIIQPSDKTVGIKIADKQRSLQVLSNYIRTVLESLKMVIAQDSPYFHNVEKYAPKLPITIQTNYYNGQNRQYVVTIPTSFKQLKEESLKAIVIQKKDFETVQLALSTKVQLAINGVVPITHSSIYAQYHTQLLLQHMFALMKKQMVSEKIDYGTTTASKKIKISPDITLSETTEESAQESVVPLWLPSVANCSCINSYKPYTCIQSSMTALENLNQFKKSLTASFCQFDFIHLSLKIVHADCYAKIIVENSKLPLLIFLENGIITGSNPANPTSSLTIPFKNLKKWCNDTIWNCIKIFLVHQAQQYKCSGQIIEYSDNSDYFTIKVTSLREVEFSFWDERLTILVTESKNMQRFLWKRIPGATSVDRLDVLLFSHSMLL